MRQPDDSEQKTKPPRRFSRSSFLKSSGAAVAGAGLAGSLASCGTSSAPQTPQGIELGGPQSMEEKYPEVPVPPKTAPNPEVLRVLSPVEAHQLDLLTGRIIPGTPDDPGAHEAHVVTYIDRMLAYHHGVVRPTYAEPPFAETYTGSSPPGESTKNGYKVIWVKKSELPRYGPQSRLAPLDQFRKGLAATDAYARKQFQKPLAKLSEGELDSIIGDLAKGKATGFKEPTATSFFGLLRTATVEGMFSDPLYGGNHNMVGWKLVGYPGAQRAYTPYDMLNEHFYRKPQSMADLMPEVPGENVGPNVILPQSGSSQVGFEYECHLGEQRPLGA